MCRRIKKLTRDRGRGQPGEENEYYITRNEYKSVINQMDMFEIRMKVFQRNNIPVEQPMLDPPHEILMRAHYTYIFDRNFDQDIEELKKRHEDEIATLLENVYEWEEMQEKK